MFSLFSYISDRSVLQKENGKKEKRDKELEKKNQSLCKVMRTTHHALAAEVCYPSAQRGGEPERKKGRKEGRKESRSPGSGCSKA